MAFQSVPETAQVSFNATLFGQLVQNTINARLVGGYEQSDIDALAAAADTAWNTSMIGLLSSDYIYRNTEARGLESVVDLIAINDTNSGDVGGQGAAEPGNVTFSVKFGTGMTGRSARGRNYVPAIPRALVSGNAITSTYAGQLVAAYDTVFAAIEATGWSPVIVSRYSLNVKRPTGVTYFILEASYVDLSLDSQRRRLAGRGD